jgi:hypothetical protein
VKLASARAASASGGIGGLQPVKSDTISAETEMPLIALALEARIPFGPFLCNPFWFKNKVRE